jgi:N-acetyl-gamma-glutamyl-phosphate reductase
MSETMLNADAAASRPPVRVALVGVSGYTGAEALRLLGTHPGVRLTALCAHAQAGRPLGDILPPFVGVPSLPVTPFDAAAVAAAADFALLAVPHGTAQEITAELLAAGVRVVDFSADHRFDDPAVYAAVYGHAHTRPGSLARTVYGLPELNRAAIADAAVVGAAGCYPTSVILAAHPAAQAGLLANDEIIADCKSGVSGAGRTASAGTHFPETSEGLHAYKTLDHRHAPEMARALGGLKVRFVPHLVPMNRGILSTSLRCARCTRRATPTSPSCIFWPRANIPTPGMCAAPTAATSGCSWTTTCWWCSRPSTTSARGPRARPSSA